jgi:hypothetical protein
MQKGTEKARDIAGPMLNEVRKKVGLK